MTSSLIIPAWKASGFLKRCLDSVDAQTLPFSEILLGIDDCAETLNAVAELRSKITTPLRVFYFQSHTGCYIIRNTLASLATYDELFFFDADDRMYPEYHSIMQSLIFAYGKAPHRVGACSKVESELPYIRHNIPSRNNPCMFAMPKSLFLAMGGFEPWECDADVEFKQRCSQLGIPVSKASRNIACEYKHSDSLTVMRQTGFNSSLRKTYRDIRDHRRQHPVYNKQLHCAPCTELSSKYLEERVQAVDESSSDVQVIDPSDTLTLILSEKAAHGVPGNAQWFATRTVACLGLSWRYTRSVDIRFQSEKVRRDRRPTTIPYITVKDRRTALGFPYALAEELEVCLYALCMNYPDIQIIGDKLSQEDKDYIMESSHVVKKNVRIVKTAKELELHDENTGIVDKES